MTPLDAVAAAIRERLIAGRPAPLPGLGTLVRQHVSARVEERADGSRMLLPPGETIGLAPAGAAHESLGEAFGRFCALDDDQAAQGYADAMDQVEARLAATGEVRLPGVGLLRRTSGGVVLGVEADLLAAVNQTYEGLMPVGTAPPEPPSSAATEPAPPTESLFSDSPPDDDDYDVDDFEDDDFGDTDSESDDDSPAAVASGSFERASEESPLRDLSSNPGSPFEPPPATEAAPARAQAPAFEPLAMSPAAAAPGQAEITDIDLPEDPLFAARPDERPASGPDLSPTDVSFVDDDTLDDDLDDVLAVPFGGGTGLTEVLAPTPDARAPGPGAPPSAPSPPSDDWTGETWTAPSSDAPPSLGDHLRDRSFQEEAEIEDAEVISDREEGAPDDVMPDDAQEEEGGMRPLMPRPPVRPANGRRCSATRPPSRRRRRSARPPTTTYRRISPRPPQASSLSVSQT